MNLPGILRPKWQHPKAEVRVAAVAALTDQALLADVVEKDESDAVRLAALQRLTDQSALARIAKSNNPFNTHAVGGITDEKEIADVARTAEAPRVRCLAVEKVADPRVLNQIVAFDDDASVRQDARSRRFRLGAEPMRGFLADVLSELPVAGTKPDCAIEICGGLDEVCAALIGDSRFRINGVLLGRREETPAAGENSASRAADPGVTDAPPSRCHVELVAAKCDAPAGTDDGAREKRYYRIKIWRMEENLFQASLEQRRVEKLHNVALWSASSGESKASFRTGETSVRVE